MPATPQSFFIGSCDKLKIVINKTRSKHYEFVSNEARNFSFCVIENAQSKDEKYILEFELFGLTDSELSIMIRIVSIVANWKNCEFFVGGERYLNGTYNFLRGLEIYKKRGRLDTVLSTSQVINMLKKYRG